MKNKVTAIVLIVAIFFLILTCSIALPIFIRPFFYAHIGLLELPDSTGYSYDAIKRAYDEMINFCTLYTPFSTGELAWSEEGKSHFTDVRALFTLDVAVMIVSAVYAVVYAVLVKTGKLTPVRFKGHGASFYAAICAIVIPVVIGALAAIDFNRAFEIFHSVFFPGKDNWLFDPSTDEIINILPEEFFRNCAILIGVGVLGTSLFLIGRDGSIRSRLRRENDTSPIGVSAEADCAEDAERMVDRVVRTDVCDTADAVGQEESGRESRNGREDIS